MSIFKKFFSFVSSSHALNITLFYIFLGSLWILLSDRILLRYSDPETFSNLQTLKGWFFIIATGILLFFLIRKSEKSILRKSNELLTSEKKFREAIDHINDLFIIYDFKARVQYLNKAALKISGRAIEEIIGKRDEEIFPKTITEVYLPIVRKSFETKEVQKDEKEIFYNNKNYSSVIECVPVLNENSDIQYVIAIWHDITERKLFEKKLLKTKNDLKALTEYLNNARENERASIARDIHDHLGQMLTGMKIDLSILKKKINENQNTSEKLAQLEDELEKTIKISRRISEELRPPVIDDLGLIPAIELFLDSFENRTNIKCTLSANVPENVISNKIAITLFRLVQEAMTNVARHADAVSAQISIELQNEALHLQIEDDGKGFDLNEIQNKSFGLIGMRERIELVDGHFELLSQKNSGTKINVQIPIKNIKQD